MKSTKVPHSYIFDPYRSRKIKAMFVVIAVTGSFSRKTTAKLYNRTDGKFVSAGQMQDVFLQ